MVFVKIRDAADHSMVICKGDKTQIKRLAKRANTILFDDIAEIEEISETAFTGVPETLREITSLNVEDALAIYLNNEIGDFFFLAEESDLSF